MKITNYQYLHALYHRRYKEIRSYIEKKMPQLDYIAVNCVMMKIDFEYYAKYGESLTGTDYIKHTRGVLVRKFGK